MSSRPDGPPSFAAAFEALLAGRRVVPVVTLSDPHQAAPLAQALHAGGIAAVEVTLRSPAGLEAIAAIARSVPLIAVGAGTILSPSQIGEAVDAGARFLVSPGTTPALAEAAAEAPAPFLPGVATVSEAMRLREMGFRLLKLFPAEAAGGVRFLDAIRPVLGGVRFCPTGGVGAANAAKYLARANVACVGGSWLTPSDAVASGDVARIARLAREAAALV